MAMAREALPNAQFLNSQLGVNFQGLIFLGVYFLPKIQLNYSRGFFPKPVCQDTRKKPL